MLLQLQHTLNLVFVKPSETNFSLPVFTSTELNSLVIKEFSSRDYLYTIRRLQPKLTMGTDMVPAFLLKDCAYFLKTPLLHIFNLIIIKLVFLLCWKISRITPVYKSGAKYKVPNYRGIFIISNVSKIFEHMLYGIIFNHVVIYLAVELHGFRIGKSIISNFLIIF